MPKQTDKTSEYSEDETERRRDEIARRMLNTPPKHKKGVTDDASQSNEQRRDKRLCDPDCDYAIGQSVAVSIVPNDLRGIMAANSAAMIECFTR